MRKEDYKATLIIVSSLAAATLTGFLRQTMIAYQLGAGRGADVYLVAFAVPEFVFIALPIIVWPVFIPLFTQYRQQVGERAAWRFALGVAGTGLVLLGVLTMVAGLTAPFYLRWLAPGFTEADYAQAIGAVRLMLPALVLMGLATLAGGMLQVYRQFARPALMTAVYNLTFIPTLLTFPLDGAVERAAWGVTLGAAMALLFQLPLLWRHYPGWSPEVGRGSAAGLSSLRQAGQLAGLLTLGYGAHHLILFVDRALATGLGVGSAAALSYAYHLALVVGQLSGLAVSMALFPRLAEQISSGDTGAARRSLADALRLVWMIGLPAGAAMIVLRVPLIRLLLEHGAFDQTATAAVSTPLAWYTLAVLADALCQPLWRVVYAQQRAGTMLAVNSLQTGLRLAANLALIPIFGYNGLALSALVGLAVQVLVLGWWVRRQLGSYLFSDGWPEARQVALATAGSLAVMISLTAGLPNNVAPLLQIILAGSLGGGVYLAALWLLGVLKQRHLASLGMQPARRSL